MGQDFRDKVENVRSMEGRHLHPPTGESMTQQHMKDDADINRIVQRYIKTGILGNPAATRQAQFGDFTSVDFMSMQNAIADIHNQWMSLKASVRRRFNDDPNQLFRFLDNPNNREEAEKLGLIPASPKPVAEGQQDLLKPEGAKPEAAPKADPEAQPNFQPKGGKPPVP